MSCQRRKPNHKFRKPDPYNCPNTVVDKSPQPKKMHILFLTWEDDDLGMSDEVGDLKTAFKQGYACATTESWAIPSSEYAGGMLKGLLETWMVDHDDGESLLVVYYGGHGGTDDSGYLTWSAQSQGGHSLDWHSIQEDLDTIRSNLLYLFDCCCSASSISSADTYDEVGESEGGVVEVIAACGFDASTPGSSRSSFTNALTVALNSLSPNRKKLSIAVLTLHRHIIRTLHEALQDAEDPPTAPIFFRLAGGDDKPSITLDLAKPPTGKAHKHIPAIAIPDDDDSDAEVEMLPMEISDVDDSDIEIEFSI
ncbi:hypothetical protein DL98DRAFT_530442 [Cadophora sp. DSE1049]|nr:hypothetical protein DL98DRAFT_530442 [Cadophora sp. DSE1049]